MELKLSNGSQINLSELDKLENKTYSNKLLKFFDNIYFGGNQNNIFDKQEIEKIKQFLLEMAGKDGIIDTNDIKKTKLKYASIFENYTEQNIAYDLSLLFLQENTKNKNNDTSPNYKVESGDTLKKIIAKLGYTGEEAKKYEQALDAQLSADGSYMNDQKWLLAGSNIKLLSDEKLTNLGIKKIDTETPTSTKESYSRKIQTGSTQEKPINDNTANVVIYNSVEKIIENIKSKGEKVRILKKDELTKEQRFYVNINTNFYKKEPHNPLNIYLGMVYKRQIAFIQMGK